MLSMVGFQLNFSKLAIDFFGDDISMLLKSAYAENLSFTKPIA